MQGAWFVKIQRGAAIVLCSLAVGTPARAADRALSLTVDGRPISRTASVALIRHGTPYVDLVEMVRVFGGLMTTKGAAVAVTFGNTYAVFAPGSARATIDRTPHVMGGTAFRYRGDVYVPLVFFIERVFPGATLRFNAASGRAQIRTTASDVRKGGRSGTRIP